MPSQQPAFDDYSGIPAAPAPRGDDSNGSDSAMMIERLIDSIGRAIPLNVFESDVSLCPAHLPVALVDAVFHFRPGQDEQAALPAKRYCLRFGVARRWPNTEELPAAYEQETLANLMAHYHELGVDRMADEVFQSRDCFPETEIERARYVMYVAGALRALGIDRLHDVRGRCPATIGEALRTLPGADEHFVRRLLLHTEDDAFVLGDGPVRDFVARALGHESIAPAQAKRLVRAAAYELVLSPKKLDFRIWLHCRARGLVGAGNGPN